MQAKPIVPELTGLRAVAIIIIAVHLFATAGVLPGEFGGSYDQVGLMIGVLLSGLLLAWRHAGEPFSPGQVVAYARGRAMRLLSAYAVVLVASIVATRWWDAWPYRFESVPDFLRAALLVQAPGMLWIVPVLAQCWVLFLLVWWWWSRGGHWSVIVLLAAVIAVPGFFGWGTVGRSGVEAQHPYLDVVGPYFLAGVGLGLAWSRLGPALARRAGAVAVVGAIVFVLAVANLPIVRVAHGWSLGTTVVGSTWLDPITAILVILLVVCAAAQATSLVVLRSRPAQFLGTHAYVLYLGLPVLAAAVASAA